MMRLVLLLLPTPLVNNSQVSHSMVAMCMEEVDRLQILLVRGIYWAELGKHIDEHIAEMGQVEL